jgi:hypothetical protein
MTLDIQWIIVGFIGWWIVAPVLRRLAQWVGDHHQELRDAYHQIRDPHGWERRYRYQRWLKYAARPAMFQINARTFVVHPALMLQFEKVKRESVNPQAMWSDLFGVQAIVSEFAVKQAPDGGWPDVEVPERIPRLVR